jgi:DNA replication and repair protein RecF
MLASLTLDEFRNYAHARLELPDGLIAVFGPNAHGKTNLLEAIHLLGTGRLLRGRRDVDAVRQGAPRARVEGALRGSGATLAVEIRAGVRKHAMFNGASLPRTSDLMGRMPCVAFTSSDLSIVRGEPGDRRSFLDAELSQVRPAYLHHLTVYKRALEQRNALLRLARETPQPLDLFEAWEGELAEHGGQIRAIRRESMASLADRATAIQARVGSGERLRLEYGRSDEAGTDADLAEALARRRDRDIAAGWTSVGPHRDDFTVWLEDRDARMFGSQGQQRTACIALKLGALHLVGEAMAVPPVLLLDDVFSELDPRRREALIEIAGELAGQTILTCTDREQVGDALGERVYWIGVHRGTAAPV